MRAPAILIGGLLLVCTGCATGIRGDRQAMLDSATRLDPGFPDGKDEMLTMFAYLGDATSNDGIIRVVFCRSALTGMLSPRGESRIYFFNAQDELIGQVRYLDFVEPLCCEGSKLYFFGVQHEGDSEGNALELRDGVANAKFVYAERIGSWTADGTSIRH